MSLTPEIKIGIWNAWILTLVFVILRIALSGKVSQKTEGRINVLINGVLFLLFVYSVFLPLPLGTAWFYTGLSVFLFGAVLFSVVYTLNCSPIIRFGEFIGLHYGSLYGI